MVKCKMSDSLINVQCQFLLLKINYDLILNCYAGRDRNLMFFVEDF